MSLTEWSDAEGTPVGHKTMQERLGAYSACDDGRTHLPMSNEVLGPSSPLAGVSLGSGAAGQGLSSEAITRCCQAAKLPNLLFKHTNPASLLTLDFDVRTSGYKRLKKRGNAVLL